MSNETEDQILRRTLNEYISDVNDPILNFRLAIVYEHMGQTAAAISFFTRAAEKTEDKLLAYESLIKMGNCFSAQGKRVYSVKSCYSRAITILPTRPEAYYLLARSEEWEQNYYQAYTMASIALEICDFESEPLRTNVGYPAKYALIFEKSISAYWWGNNMECRKLLQNIVNDYWDELDDSHRSMVENNITRLGSGPESQAFTYYQKDEHDKLRFKFKDSKKIEKNYSQVYQDLFILSMLNGKKNGTYIEIGGGTPYLGNNTTLLEFNYGWTGFSLETNEQFVEEYRRERDNPIYSSNALAVNYKKLFEQHFDTKEIDYLQLDIEPAKNTFECLMAIPFDEYKFAVITYEHDYYVDVTKSYRDKSRRYLKMMGYELVVNDVSPDGISNFEDWWVHPDLVDPKILEIMRDTSEKTKKAKNYMLGKE